ncbi:MAG: hypothetical protein HRU15_12720 [Planctomycetes bacterium]|nr:hypothetical protein [Planctomycetota bacterium]
MYAAIEGVAGVKDLGRGLDTALIAPRWSASDSTQADVCVKLPSSGGYVSYNWQQTSAQIHMTLTASAEDKHCEILLPEGKSVDALTVNGENTAVSIKTVESSQYLCLLLSDIAAYSLIITLK